MPKTKIFRDITEIDPYATCISLEIPQMFSCSVCCEKYKNVVTHTRKKRKEERCKSERNKCKQLWHNVVLKTANLTDGEILKRRLQCRFLNLELKEDVHLRKEPMRKVTSNESTMKEPTTNELNTHENIDTGNCCGAPKMLALSSESPDNTNIFTHGKNCHIDVSQSQPESALEETPAATQTGSEHVLAKENNNDVSEAQNVTPEKKESHLFQRVAKRRLSSLEKDANRWREMKKAMKRKNMLVQTLAESL